MHEAPDLVSRRDRQRLTREALIVAAREIFARDGYHGANLEVIARQAGFSKGAVYSNFDGKAALFLAVMEANIDVAFAEPWDPFQHDSAESSSGEREDWDTEEFNEAIAGFSLATLEFIATAARDEALSVELARNIQKLLDRFTQIARMSAAPDDAIALEDVAALLAALDQGASILLLTGGVAIDQRSIRLGMRRLLDPVRAAASTEPEARNGAASHDQILRRRIAAAVREGRAR